VMHSRIWIYLSLSMPRAAGGTPGEYATNCAHFTRP
jgi:hypothetical protein